MNSNPATPILNQIDPEGVMREGSLGINKTSNRTAVLGPAVCSASFALLNRAHDDSVPESHPISQQAPSYRVTLSRDRLDEAKRRVTLSAAARILGLPQLRSHGGQRSPLREDRHASFSVQDDRLFKDFATGAAGDVVDFVELATGCNRGTAIRRVIEWAGFSNGLPLPRLRLALPPRPARQEPRTDRLSGLHLREPTTGELAQIKGLRGWSFFAGLEIASRRGLLRVANVPHGSEVVPAWILTDSARRTAWARRLDGQKWQFAHGPAKANALRSQCDHPPGLADVLSADRRAVLVCEGEPDTLAALSLAWVAGKSDALGFICLSGASRRLSPDVCASLLGRRVRIVRQSDPPGPKGYRPSHTAAAGWLSSLTVAGVSADCLSLDGLNVKDLADLLQNRESEQLKPIAAAVLRGLLP